MSRSIYLIEGAIYLGVGLLLGLFRGQSGLVVESVFFSLFCYVAYLFLNRVWNHMSGYERIISLIFTCGAILVVLIPGDLVRRLAFGFYTGDRPIETAFSGSLRR